jgi:hypothetical protein
MFGNYLLAGVFGAVIVSVIGFWSRRYPRRTWVIGTEISWWLAGHVLTAYLLYRIAAGRPEWVLLAGIIAHGVLWLGLFTPVMSRRLFSRLGR